MVTSFLRKRVRSAGSTTVLGRVASAVDLPTIVSFYGGDQYYYEAAKRLRADCDRLNLKHDIREVKKLQSEDWADVCRKKIGFYREMIGRHPEGIFWLDVDTRIVRVPELLRGSRYDFAAFLRNLNDLRHFDPMLYGRTFHPGFLHFTSSTLANEFVSHLAQIEQKSSIRATDDFFLEEGFRSFPKALSIALFPSDLIVRREEDIQPQTCFIFGASGNVSSFVNKVEQHKPTKFMRRRQQAMLKTMATEAVKAGDRNAALVFYSKAYAVDRTNRVAALDYAKLLAKCRDFSSSLKVLNASFPKLGDSLDASKLIVECSIELGDVVTARNLLVELNESSNLSLRAFVQSRAFRLTLEERAQALGPDIRRPEVWWMESPFPGNLGDLLNAYIIERLSGIPPRHTEAGEGILAIGSVVKFARKGTEVWGTGTPRMTDKLSPEARYRAVRGPLTRQLVLESGGVASDLYGDAALLLPLIFKPRTRKKHKLGLVRHYTHRNEPLRLEGVKEINILRAGYDETEAFIDELFECERVISTSLHGLIISHAYGIPTRWATFTKGQVAIPGDGTKFEDHYRAFGIRFRPPLDLSEIQVLTPAFATECDELITLPVQVGRLLQAAPFPVKPEFLATETYLPAELFGAGQAV